MNRELAKETNGSFFPIVTDHLGTPKELFDTEGNVLWQAEHALWGNAEVTAKKTDNYQPIVDCNLRFQNQWEDQESGLYYNLNRYYDPDSGQYLSPDPIGLEGGLRTHGYVHDPMLWVDPLGLAGCATPKPYDGVKQASDYLRNKEVPRRVRKEVLESFDRKAMIARTARANEYGLRYYDNDNAVAKGRYLFETFPASRQELALDPKWNQMSYLKQWKIKETATIFEGPASSQGTGLEGGKTQKYIADVNNILEP